MIKVTRWWWCPVQLGVRTSAYRKRLNLLASFQRLPLAHDCSSKFTPLHLKIPLHLRTLLFWRLVGSSFLAVGWVFFEGFLIVPVDALLEPKEER